MTEQPEAFDELYEDGPSLYPTLADRGEDEEEASSLAMFEGDTSTLFREQRHCLHALLKSRYISAERHPEHWATLLAGHDIIRSRLNDLFLDVHIDREHQVAFKRPATADGSDPLPSLLRNVANSKEETIVMMSLRQRFFAQRQEGNDVVFVDREALLDEVADKRPEHATNRAMDHKRADKAIDGLATSGVLLRTEDPDRFRISPIVEVLMPIETMRALWTWLLAVNGSDDGPPDTDDAEEEQHLLLDADGA